MRNTIPGQYNVTVKTVLMWMPLFPFSYRPFWGSRPVCIKCRFFIRIWEATQRWLTFKMKELCYFTFVGELWILFHVNCHPDCFYICSREIFISLLTLLLYRVISKLINYWWWFKFTCQGTLLLRYHWARL